MILPTLTSLLLLCGYVYGNQLLRGGRPSNITAEGTHYQRELTGMNARCEDSPFLFKANDDGVMRYCSNRDPREVTFAIMRHCPISTNSSPNPKGNCGWPPLLLDTENKFFIPSSETTDCN